MKPKLDVKNPDTRDTLIFPPIPEVIPNAELERIRRQIGKAIRSVAFLVREEKPDKKDSLTKVNARKNKKSWLATQRAFLARNKLPHLPIMEIANMNVEMKREYAQFLQRKALELLGKRTQELITENGEVTYRDTIVMLQAIFEFDNTQFMELGNCSTEIYQLTDYLNKTQGDFEGNQESMAIQASKLSAKRKVIQLLKTINHRMRELQNAPRMRVTEILKRPMRDYHTSLFDNDSSGPSSRKKK